MATASKDKKAAKTKEEIAERLRKAIDEWDKASSAFDQKCLKLARTNGALLQQYKDFFKKGEFGPAVEKEFPKLSRSTRANWLRVYGQWDKLVGLAQAKCINVDDMGLKAALKLLAKPKPKPTPKPAPEDKGPTTIAPAPVMSIPLSIAQQPKRELPTVGPDDGNQRLLQYKPTVTEEGDDKAGEPELTAATGQGQTEQDTVTVLFRGIMDCAPAVAQTLKRGEAILSVTIANREDKATLAAMVALDYKDVEFDQ